MCRHVFDCEFRFGNTGDGGAWTDSTQAYLYDNDDRFFPGWKLDDSWIFCTISWSVMVLTAAFISASAYLVAPEGGYELIPGEY